MAAATGSQRHIRTAQKLARERGIELSNRDLAYLEEGTAEFDVYLRELAWAQSFAFENRAEMTDPFRQAVAHWAHGWVLNPTKPTVLKRAGCCATTTTPVGRCTPPARIIG